MRPDQLALLPRVVDRIRALGDETRVRLLMRLREGDANVSTLVEAVGAQQASVSKHLAVLRAAGLIDFRREGTQAIYGIVDESVFQLCEILCSGVVRHLQAQQELLVRSQSNRHTERHADHHTTSRRRGPRSSNTDSSRPGRR